MNAAETLRPHLDRAQRLGLIVGGAGLAACVVLALVFGLGPAFRSYLIGYLYWVGLSLGCLSWMMIHNLVGGAWGFVIRRPLEAGALTLPLMAVLFLPLLLGLGLVYQWASPEGVAASEVLQHAHFKMRYLSTAGFIVRAVVYFVVWSVLAFLMVRWSREQDRAADPAPTWWASTVSGPGLALVFLTATFAMIDWAMSIEPAWYSTMFGALMIVGAGHATLSLMILLASRLADDDPALGGLATPGLYNDLGNLMLAFTMLWGYMNFSQYLIIWSGNLAEEVPWYLHRGGAGWQAVIIALIALRFATPFALLLSRDNKRDPRVLAAVAVLILVMHAVDLVWLIAPTFYPPRVSPTFWAPEGYTGWWGLASWALVGLVPTLAALAGIGGLWAAAFAWQLKDTPLVPLRDPRLMPSAAAEHA